MAESLPTDPVLYLTVDEVLTINEALIASFGGASGVRDLGALESALYRPRTGYYSTLPEMAAALFESLIMNRPFTDGRVRTAFFTTDIFLRLNGWKFAVLPNQAHAFLTDLLQAGRCDYRHLLPWVRGSVMPAT